MANGATLVDSPLLAGRRTTLESFPPSQGPIVGLWEPTPWEKPTLSPSPTKQERVAALHVLARDLSQRLDREMGILELANRSWGRHGPFSGAPTLSEYSLAILKPEIPQTSAGAELDGGGIWERSFPQNLSTDAGKTREKMEGGDGLSAHRDKTSPGCEILRCRSSEKKQSAADKTGLEDVHKG